MFCCLQALFALLSLAFRTFFGFLVINLLALPMVTSFSRRGHFFVCFLKIFDWAGSSSLDAGLLWLQ